YGLTETPVSMQQRRFSACCFLNSPAPSRGRCI
ncbi:MAG: hypothetical protein ACI9ZD_002744, partial [Paracoccaceae bacterium]